MSIKATDVVILYARDRLAQHCVACVFRAGQHVIFLPMPSTRLAQAVVTRARRRSCHELGAASRGTRGSCRVSCCVDLAGVTRQAVSIDRYAHRTVCMYLPNTISRTGAAADSRACASHKRRWMGKATRVSLVKRGTSGVPPADHPAGPGPAVPHRQRTLVVSTVRALHAPHTRSNRPRWAPAQWGGLSPRGGGYCSLLVQTCV